MYYLCLIKQKDNHGFDYCTSETQIAIDSFFREISKIMPVDFMPGPNDPATFVWPQQPVHSSILPQSSVSENFHRVTNPHWFAVDKTW